MVELPESGRGLSKRFKCRVRNPDRNRVIMVSMTIVQREENIQISILRIDSEVPPPDVDPWDSNLSNLDQERDGFSFYVNESVFEEFIDMVRKFYSADAVDGIQDSFDITAFSPDDVDLEETPSSVVIRLGNRRLMVSPANESEVFLDSTVDFPWATRQEEWSDRNSENLEELHNFLNQFDYESDVSFEATPVLEEERKQELIEETVYGEEMVRHLEEGDKCYELGLLQPALNSYIHAIEWGLISLLREEADFDVIEREHNGELFYFAKGAKNLLDEVKNQVGLDQKTYSKLNSMNSAERRWSAHHKSGEIFREDIDSIRVRIQTLAHRHSL